MTATSQGFASPDGNPPAALRVPAGWATRLVTLAWLVLAVLSLAAGLARPALLLGPGLKNPELIEKLGLRGSPDGVAPFSAEAIRSGIRTGDVPISIDGYTFGQAMLDPSAGRIQDRLRDEGRRVRLVVRSRDGALAEHLLTVSGQHLEAHYAGSGITPIGDWWFKALLGAVGSIVLCAAAALIVVRANRQIAPLLLAFGLVMIPAVVHFGVSQRFGLEWLRGPAVVGGWTIFIVAILLFPSGRFARPWHLWAVGALVVGTLLNVGGIIPGSYWIPLHVLTLVGAVGSLMLRYQRMPQGPERQQIRWALFGFAAGGVMLLFVVVLVFGIFTRDIPPLARIWGALLNQLLIFLLLLAIAGGLLVSVLRYRLYDAEAVISRSVSFGALALALVSLFAGTERVIELLGEEWFGEELGVLAGGIGAAVAAAMIVPLHHRLSNWAERRFRKQLLRLRTGLPVLVDDLRETAPVARIAAATLDNVIAGVRASRAAIVMDGTLIEARGVAADKAEQWRRGWLPAAQDGFDIDASDPLFSLRIPLEADGHGRIGWLLLGARPDGTLYGKDEREVLAAIADPVARALEIAARREVRETAERERWQQQDSLNAQLARTLTAIDAKLDRLLPSPQPGKARKRRERSGGDAPSSLPA